MRHTAVPGLLLFVIADARYGQGALVKSDLQGSNAKVARWCASNACACGMRRADRAYSALLCCLAHARGVVSQELAVPDLELRHLLIPRNDKVLAPHSATGSRHLQSTSSVIPDPDTYPDYCITQTDMLQMSLAR